MTWVLLLASVALADDPDCFFTGAGPELACIEAGMVRGLPVQRTGAVVVRSQHPEALAALPEVAHVEDLGGRGDVVRVVARPGVDEAVRVARGPQIVAGAGRGMCTCLTIRTA